MTLNLRNVNYLLICFDLHDNILLSSLDVNLVARKLLLLEIEDVLWRDRRLVPFSLHSC